MNIADTVTMFIKSPQTALIGIFNRLAHHELRGNLIVVHMYIPLQGKPDEAEVAIDQAYITAG